MRRGLGRGAMAAPALLLGLLAGPMAAKAEDLVVLRDGSAVRVERAETLPDRVRITPQGGPILLLPDGTRVQATGPQGVELPRESVRAVFPVPNIPAEVRPHAERGAGMVQQLTDQVHRDLGRSWSKPLPPAR